MRIPTATYRLQFWSNFGFNEAKKIVNYLSELGISDLYASPIFKARSGSTHGYDVVDANVLNPELGTEEDFNNLIADLQNKGMGWVQDIVPNHRAYDSDNKALMDVLEHGKDSEYYTFFDIEWEHHYEDLREKVLTPMLGDFYGNCLENGDIQLSYDESGLSVKCYDSFKLPLRIETYLKLLSHDLGKLNRQLGRSHPDFIKILGILYLIKNVFSEASGRQRKDQVEFIQGLVWELYNNNPEVQTFIDQNIATFNGEVGKPETFDLLDQLLSEQFFRLSFWKVGAEELNYRRFFTVNELICLRVEDELVFKKTHELICQLVQSGKITGLRIDHIDGLYDPTQYLFRLREMMGDVYLVVEKILEKEEKLPSHWPIEGTSGYDTLNRINGVFCQTSNQDKFSEIYTKLTRFHDDYEKLLSEKKHLIAETNLVGDIDNLAHLLKRIAEQSRYGRDFTLSGLRKAILEVLVQFPIYCTYINENGITETDQGYIREAIEKAKSALPRLLKELNLIEKFLLLDYDEHLSEEEKQKWLHFTMRFQQFTGPLMAKGVEDTLFYVYARFVSLNEVGGFPQTFGVTLEEFNQFNQQQLANHPHTMNASSTHDTKRSEDVRARLNVISEIPDEWERQINEWRNLNKDKKTIKGKRIIPDNNDEYFFYQNLLGAFPLDEEEYPDFVERVKNYIIKAVREAKIHTAWLRPDHVYEDGFLHFVEQVLQPENNPFLEQFREFKNKVAPYGLFNSLSQTLVKITSPGIPDFYQGTELWDFSLVDPDNRRPVDYQKRLSYLEEIKHRSQDNLNELIHELTHNMTDGRIKLWLIIRALGIRNQYLSVFQQGDYIPLSVQGQYKDHVIAYARHQEKTTIVTIVPRFLTALIEPYQYPTGEQVWGDTYVELPFNLESGWKNSLTEETLSPGDKLSIANILKSFPIALLIND
ncbi:malto-oligosyltrehalose synthase [Gloeothece citriformis PCC 7424]|uniref:Malto-oligosyltrehalose synthase n=1 Tax=Gloeothece citriformis (strain PCC 7424) TaxID=65393 RepID=B7KBK4_GLOC7|nr:malto-oligosyltrehalose synthase [Gloeothece citriformis]ACK72982.1 malto-oligosyltrehalose synthase [Gloeothece citriformis PCC 7424]